MVLAHIEIIMQVSSIALVTGAAGFCAGTELDMRPKRIDEQTLIGGTIWSQIIIPIGILLSQVVEENLDPRVKGYFLVTGVLLLWMTGIVLMLHEKKRFRIEQRRINALKLRVDSWSTQTSIESLKTQKPGVVSKSQQTAYVPMKIKFHYDKAYYTIGVMCFIAGAVKMLELAILLVGAMMVFMAYWGTVSIMRLNIERRRATAPTPDPRMFTTEMPTLTTTDGSRYYPDDRRF